jgi:hypothetical protein
VAPDNGATGTALDVLLDWESSPRSSRYAYCIDTINNSACDSSWKLTSSTSALIKELAPSTTHYWQVRADNIYGSTYADSTAWWSFTTGSAPGSANFLPLLMNKTCSTFPSSTEIEPNNAAPQANGPLCFNSAILGNPNNNSGGPTAADFDWFSFNWSGNGTLHVDVTNFLFDAQVLLYYDLSAPELDKDYLKLDGHYEIDYAGTGAAGTYYVLVFAPDGHPTDSGDYTLTISVQ